MITLLLMLAVLGFVVYLIVTFIPMPDPIRKAIIVIALVLIVLYLVNLFGLDLPIPHR